MRWLVGAGLLIAMLAFGIGVYHGAGLLRGGRPAVHRPSEVTAAPLPGTLYVVQAGAIYRFHHGNFTPMTREEGWMQPAIAPNHQLVAVRRQANFSDLYLMSTGGKTVAPLTNDSSATSVEANRWAFYPRISPDGQTLFYDVDTKDPFNIYGVDLAIFGLRLDSSSGAVQWTQPNDFTGGDVDPIPLRGGGLIYTKYSIDDAFQVHSQVWFQRRAGSPGQALTAPELGCGQAAVSPDEKLIAMVCTKGSTQSADLDVVTFDPDTLAVGSAATLVSDRLVASPAFSPEGKMIAYLAPVTPGGQFQLWTVDTSGPASAHAITTDLGLDSTSAPAWVGG